MANQNNNKLSLSKFCIITMLSNVFKNSYHRIIKSNSQTISIC